MELKDKEPMSHQVTVELSDDAFAALQTKAAAAAQPVARVAAAVLEQQFAAGPSLRSAEEEQLARIRFERHFGAIDLGAPTGIDNDAIDADLAREYAEGRPL